jgi:hypothetical protein
MRETFRTPSQTAASIDGQSNCFQLLCSATTVTPDIFSRLRLLKDFYEHEA